MKTKKKLIFSLVTLLLCSCMFIGSTLAWFTDSVSNTGNKIQAGTLDIDLLQRYDTMSDEQKATFAEAPHDREFVSLDTDALRTIGVFDYDKWEPGYTEAKLFKIQNKGNLALKFKLLFNVENEVKTPARLADVIDVYIKTRSSVVPAKLQLPDKFDEDKLLSTKDGSDYGYTKTTLSELIDDPDGAAYGIMPTGSQMISGPTALDCAIILHMREDAGNEYQNLSVGSKLDINLFATQYTIEKDGFGSNQYDKDATFDHTITIKKPNGDTLAVLDDIDSSWTEFGYLLGTTFTVEGASSSEQFSFKEICLSYYGEDEKWGSALGGKQVIGACDEESYSASYYFVTDLTNIQGSIVDPNTPIDTCKTIYALIPLF